MYELSLNDNGITFNDLEKKFIIRAEPFAQVVNKSIFLLIKQVCASFDKVNYFKKLTEATIAEKYNVDEIQTRILNMKC